MVAQRDADSPARGSHGVFGFGDAKGEFGRRRGDEFFAQKDALPDTRGQRLLHS